MPEAPHVVVIGGGISGLTAAHRFNRRGVTTTVVEAADTPGGKLRASPVAGVSVDAGAEAVLARRPEALDLFTELGLDERVVHPGPGAAAVYSRGRVRALPKGQLMGVPGDLRALARSGVLSPAGTLRAALDLVWPSTPVRSDVPVAAYVGTRMGRQVVERLVEPLLGGVYAGRADELSLDSALPQIAPMARSSRSLMGAVHTSLRGRGSAPAGSGPVFASLRGGVASVVDALAERQPDLRTGTRAGALERTPRGWSVRLDGGERVACDAVLLACPAPEAARLLADTEPAAARELGGIEYASMALVTFALPAAAFPEPLTGTGFLVPAGEGLTIKAATFSSNKWPWLARELDRVNPGEDLVVLRCSIGRSGDDAALRRSDEELARVALADLARVTGLTGSPVQTRVTRWTDGLPQYAVGHAARVERIRSGVRRHPGLGVCGAAYGGVGIPACVADADREAGRLADTLTDHSHTDRGDQSADGPNQQGVNP
ncbi:protoporphyrinogen oxidase [Nocardiopsis terrae]|uniref:Coproporphyrinogen III oxidase n=1 Tax=Nocardiopsis terrae TaxID=372655 RepID=A0ABR9HFA8_9ACTN|nr:protoporphyrinogen oxidase [Nocardiopsis terrae]MBE1457720.1 oxygen-dependent protoporphyrinogen oxidase [Nocardiopsis terrae]GHC84603.1 protoporphyrinogen oxidase [Nocardiopsis terrae]